MRLHVAVFLCASFVAGACATAQTLTPAPQTTPAQTQTPVVMGAPIGAVKQTPMKRKKPKNTTPEETAKIKADINRQIEALPKQGPPMLDESSVQVRDPDGHPIFYPAPQPMLDKHGEPWLDVNGKLMLQSKNNMGYDHSGKKLKVAKEKKPKKVPVKIVQATLTVDGWTGKAAMNYDIDDLKYMYMFVPEIGTVIVSNAEFPGATEQKAAFDGKNLTINVAEHVLQLSNEERLLGKKPESAWVRVDPAYTLPSRFPVFGYGTMRSAPYGWPGSKELVATKGRHLAPPLPKDVRPAMAWKPCPAGMSRPAAEPGVLTGPPPPCAPITASTK